MKKYTANRENATVKLIQTMRQTMILLLMDPETFCEWVARNHGVVITPVQAEAYRTGVVCVMLKQAIDEVHENDKLVWMEV